jgi:hypothetical protein
VQKLIESLRTREEIRLVVDALRPGFLELIKDPNGNHVVQKCLQSFEADDNKVCGRMWRNCNAIVRSGVQRKFVL